MALMRLVEMNDHNGRNSYEERGVLVGLIDVGTTDYIYSMCFTGTQLERPAAVNAEWTSARKQSAKSSGAKAPSSVLRQLPEVE